MPKLKFAKPIKAKKLTQKSLVKQLDVIVSKLVIARDKKCVQCGSTTKLTCGHLFGRRAYSTRWDLVNCNCQCWACNYGHGLDTSKYTRWFMGKYGLPVWDALYLRFHTPRKWKVMDLQAMLGDFKEQLKKYELLS